MKIDILNKGLSGKATAPHRTAPHRTAPHRTAPHRTAPHRTKSITLSNKSGKSQEIKSSHNKWVELGVSCFRLGCFKVLTSLETGFAKQVWSKLVKVSGQSKRGFSLTEMLVTVGVAGVIGAVGVVQYGGHQKANSKRELLNSARMLVMAVKTCVASAGGWELDRTSIGGSKMYPCFANKIKKTDDSDAFKDKLGYDCPKTKKEDCGAYNISDKEKCCRGFTDTTKKQYYCIDIRQEIKGEKHQVIVRYNIDKQSAEIFCRAHNSYRKLNAGSCKASNAFYESWNGGNTDCQCQWPEDSESGTCPTAGTTTGGSSGGTSSTGGASSTTTTTGGRSSGTSGSSGSSSGGSTTAGIPDPS